jgi:hypothetical protein
MAVEMPAKVIVFCGALHGGNRGDLEPRQNGAVA